MPRFYPENNLSLPSDNEMRSLHKIVDLLGGGTGGSGGGGGALAPEVFKGNLGGAAPSVTPSTSAAIFYDLDPGNAMWLWNGVSWL